MWILVFADKSSLNVSHFVLYISSKKLRFLIIYKSRRHFYPARLACPLAGLAPLKALHIHINHASLICDLNP